MECDQHGMEMPGAITTAELARRRRRVRFLEATAAQLLRGRGRLREWFSATEIAGMGLAGLPRTPGGIRRMAQARGWETATPGGDGTPPAFHYTSLPCAAFEAMVDLVLASAPDGAAHGDGQLAKMPCMARRETTVVACGDDARSPRGGAAPPWVAPVLRMIRTEKLSLGVALRRVPARIAIPNVTEARAVLTELGVLGR